MSTIISDAAASSPGIDDRLATRLRAERDARGWSLAELAARSGVSRAMLSKIERGDASPTASLLGRLSAAFGLTLSQLFARVEAGGGGRLLRQAEQPIWRDPETGLLRRSVSPPGGPAGVSPVELVWIVFPVGAEVRYPAASYDIIADQQIVVIDGALTLQLGDEVVVVTAGDAYRWGAPRDVTFRNHGDRDCTYLVAVLRAVR